MQIRELLGHYEDYETSLMRNNEVLESKEVPTPIAAESQTPGRQLVFNEMFDHNCPDQKGGIEETKKKVGEILKAWTLPFGNHLNVQGILARHTTSYKSDPLQLAGWLLNVSKKALGEDLPIFKGKKVISKNFVKKLVCLSIYEDGPLLAQNFLKKSGIHCIIEPHNKKIRIDGAAFFLRSGIPVIALTVRHDRIDNFWFTLLHELAHHALHLSAKNSEVFIDDLDEMTESNSDADKIERDANTWASENLIPTASWEESDIISNPTQGNVRKFATKLGIHPAIPAGRCRYLTSNFRILSNMVGNKQVRQLFPEFGVKEKYKQQQLF